MMRRRKASVHEKNLLKDKYLVQRSLAEDVIPFHFILIMELEISRLLDHDQISFLPPFE